MPAAGGREGAEPSQTSTGRGSSAGTSALGELGMERDGESAGEELEKERGAGRCPEAAPGGGGGTAGPSEISGSEAQPETLGAVLGKHLE